MPVNCPLPAEQLLDRQVIAQARLLQADQAKADGLHDGGLAPCRPTLGVGRGKFDRHPLEMGAVGHSRLIIPASKLISPSRSPLPNRAGGAGRCCGFRRNTRPEHSFVLVRRSSPRPHKADAMAKSGQLPQPPAKLTAAHDSGRFAVPEKEPRPVPYPREAPPSPHLLTATT